DEYVSNQTGDARYPLSTALYSAVFGSGTGTAPTIATSSLPAGAVGAAYSQTLTATGATPITWSLSGSLPAGLSLNSSTGAITGTPTTSGTSALTVQATNLAGTATKLLSLAINPYQPPASSGPFAYWKLDGSGSKAADSSGNGLTANLFNAPSW